MFTSEFWKEATRPLPARLLDLAVRESSGDEDILVFDGERYRKISNRASFIWEKNMANYRVK